MKLIGTSLAFTIPASACIQKYLDHTFIFHAALVLLYLFLLYLNVNFVPSYHVQYTFFFFQVIIILLGPVNCHIKRSDDCHAQDQAW